jgi:hypothetical protein
MIRRLSSNRSLARHCLTHFEALEFGMLEIKRTRGFVAGTRVRGAKFLRPGPGLEG